SDQPESDRASYGLGSAACLKLGARVANVEVHGVLAQAKDSSNVPRGLTLHRPLQDLGLSRGQFRAILVLGYLWEEQPECSALSVGREQLKVSHDASECRVILRKRPVAIDAQQEVAAFWQVKGHGYPGVVAEWRLEIPQVPGPGLCIHRLVVG